MGTNLRMLAVAVTVSLIGLVFAAAASANVETKSNGAVTISAGLVSNGPNPDVATAGNWITASLSVKNIIPASQWVHVYLTAEFPWGLIPTYDFLREMKVGERWGFQVRFPVFRFMPLGLYRMTLITDSPDIIDSLVVSAGLTVVR